MSENILLVEAEEDIADLIEAYLKSENFCVYKFYNAKAALDCMEKVKIDLAVFGGLTFVSDRLSILEKIKGNYDYPVLILSSKEENNQTLDFAWETVEYLKKPFRPGDLIARVKSQIRRFAKRNKMGNDSRKHILMVSGLELNEETQECMADEKQVALTPTEFKMLWILCKNRGNVVKTEQLFTEAWGETYYSAGRNLIMAHIRHLREKLDDLGEKGRYIKTVWGVGYKIEG